MAANVRTGIKWNGLEEFKLALRALPDELKGEARHIVEAHTNRAEASIKPNYPVRTGNLRDHLQQRPVAAGPFGVAIELVNTAKHAGLFEYGTQARHTSLGVSRGIMPPGNVFFPVVRRERRAMWVELMAMVERWGLRVHGDAADAA